tara:strand:- start:328 stop:7452 length:7125 start_codon:yes stop_codon:yes gene_type:complete
MVNVVPLDLLPKNLRARVEEEEKDNLVPLDLLPENLGGVDKAIETPIVEEPVEELVEEPRGFFDRGFDYLSEQVNALPTAPGGRLSLPQLALKGADFLNANPFKEKQNRIEKQLQREIDRKDIDETYERGEEISGMQEVKQLKYTLEDAGRNIGGTASLALEAAGFMPPGSTAKALEEYEAFGGDRRIQEMIDYSTEEGEKGKSKLGRATKGSIAMLEYLWNNPMAGVNFLAMQAPAMLTAIGPGKLAKMGTGTLLKAIGAARKIPKISNLLSLSAFGAAFNSTMVMFQSLGSNYEAGLQKFNGDQEQAKNYAFEKTTAEMGPNAIAGALLPIRIGLVAPSVARQGPVKSVIGDVIGQGAVQATGGVQGAIAGAEAVGEEVELGELVAEGLFEFSTAPIDLALSKGEINVIEAKQQLVNQFAEQFGEGVVTEEQVAQATKIVDDGTTEGKSLSEIGKDLDSFARTLFDIPEVTRRRSLNRQEQVDSVISIDEKEYKPQETINLILPDGSQARLTQEQALKEGYIKLRKGLKTVPAGTPRITPKEQKITLFDEQGQEVEGVVEKQNSAGAIQANVNGESVLVGESRFSTLDPTAPNREFETLDEAKNVSELSDQELASVSETVETQVKNLGEAGSVLPTYNPLVRDLTSLRAEQERRGIRPIAKATKPRVKVRGVIQNPTKQDIRKLTQGQQTEFNFGTPSILGPQKPKTTTEAQTVAEVVPEQSALDIETTSDVDTQIDNILNTIDKPASTVADIDTEFLDSMATQLQYEDSMYDDLTGEERIDLFARALQVTQAPEMQGTTTAQSAATILERASPFQIKLAEEKLTTLGAAPNEQLSYKAEPVASQGHTKKLGFGKLTDIPKREDLKSETEFMRSLDELMNAYAMGLERPEDLVPRIDALLARAKRLRKNEKELRNTRQRQGGTRLIKTRLNEAVRRGELNPKTYDLFEWVINQNPELAAQVGISVIKRTDKIDKGTRGSYTPYERKISRSLQKLADALDDPNYNPLMGVIRIIKDGANSKSDTAVHELLHHMERMLPSDVQTSIREAWEKGLNNELKIALQKEKVFLEALNIPSGLTNVELVAANPTMYEELQKTRLRMRALAHLKEVNVTKNGDAVDSMYGAFDARDNGMFDRIKKELGLPLDTVPLQNEDYQYFNPSEFWAVNASRILEGRYDIKDNVIKKIKNWVSEFITKLKGLVGIDPNSPVLKALDDLIKGKISAEFKSEDMLSQYYASLNDDAVAQVNEMRSVIGENEPQSKKGVGETKKFLTELLNGAKKATKYAATNPPGAVRYAWLGLLDTFSIFDSVRKSTNTVLENYVNRLEEIIGNLRKDQTRLMNLGTKKLNKFARFVNEAPIAGRILQELMSVSTAIRFDPSKYKSIKEAFAKDRGIAILENRLKNQILNEEDLDTADYIFGENWVSEDIQQQINERKDVIRSLMRDWLALGKMQRAPSRVQQAKDTKKDDVGTAAQVKPYLGEAHDIYSEIASVYKQILNEQEAIRFANIDKTSLPEETKDSLKLEMRKKYKIMRDSGPYFPLYRFGDFWFRVPKGNKNYGLWTYETKEQRDDAKRKMEDKLRSEGQDPSIITSADTRKLLQKEVSNDSILQNVINKLDAIVNVRKGSGADLTQPDQNRINKDIKAIKDEFIELYLQTLPDKDLRSRMLKRKAVPGYSTDQVRAFATYMSAVAAQLPRSKYRKDSELATQQAREGTQEDFSYDSGDISRQVINELEQRMNFQFAPPKFSEALKMSEVLLSQTVFYKYLVGVDTFLQNYSVLTTFLPAILGAKYGYTSTVKTLSKYLTAAANPISKIDTQGVELGSLELGVTDVEDFSLFNTPLVQNNPVLQAAYRFYNNQAGFNTNYISDLTHFASQATEVSLEKLINPSTTQKFLNGASLGFRITERQTREIVYLVAFDLAFKKKLKKVKAGDTKGVEQAFEESVTEAKENTQEVAFNYDPFNRNFNRLVNRNDFVGWAARQGSRLGSFRFQAIGLVLRNLFMGVGVIRNIKPRERVRALQNLIGLFTFSAITGGIPAATGSWGLFLVLGYFAQDAIRESFDDDIPEEAKLKAELSSKFNNRNLMLWFYKDWLPSKFGGEETFMTRAARGGVFNAITGYDFASKLDFDFVAPSVYSRPASSVDAFIGNIATAMLGVTASDAEGLYINMSEFIDTLSADYEGKYEDALGMLALRAITSQNQIRDIYTGAEEKLTNKTNARRAVPISKEEISAVDTIMRMLMGVDPARRAEQEKIIRMIAGEITKVDAEISKVKTKVRKLAETAEAKKGTFEGNVAERRLGAAREELKALEVEKQGFTEFGAIGQRGDEAVIEGRERATEPLTGFGLSKQDAEDLLSIAGRRKVKVEQEARKREQQE